MKKGLLLEILSDFLYLRTTFEHTLSPITSAFGLTPMQTTLLYLLEQNRENCAGRLVKKYNLNQGNFSSLCKKLEADGFIEKCKSDTDERKTVITLTKKAYDALTGIENIMGKNSPDFYETMKNADISLKSLTDFADKISLSTEKNMNGDILNA